MEETIMTIDLNLKKYRPHNSTSFSGRPQGLLARSEMKISDLDKNQEEDIQLVIPEDTTSFNPSFFLGLLYESIRKLGLEGFKKKYHWKLETDNEDRKRALLKNIDDGYRSALNSLGDKNIFSIFS